MVYKIQNHLLVIKKMTYYFRNVFNFLILLFKISMCLFSKLV